MTRFWRAAMDNVRPFLACLQPMPCPADPMPPSPPRAGHPRAEYDARMHRVLAHVDAHLDGPLDLTTLAEVANFSPFHFHRMFAAWMGETLGDHLRRRRLEVAAMRLAAQPRVRVLEVALSVGFGSGEAFARAFQARFGSSPTAWRRQQAAQRRADRHPDQAHRKLDQAGSADSYHHRGFTNPLTEPALNPPLNVHLVNRPATTVAYLRRVGPYGPAIPEFWQQTYVPWAVRHGLMEVARYGISHDDPGITAPDQCRYDACAEVPPDFVPSGGALKATLPAGRYAVLPFFGTSEEVGQAWAALLRDWLPESGLQLDARPSFEHYPRGARYDPASGAFKCEICVPVMPL